MGVLWDNRHFSFEYQNPTWHWNPPNLEQVSKDMVDQYFSPLSEFEPGLELPIKQRETFT
ncbi:hypothetical protein CsSME_00024276 [Camellia sinensis var. sinensis]